MEKQLRALVEKLKKAAGDNLRAVVLYGSAARGDYQPKFSDLNLLCVLGRLDGAVLDALGPVIVWWTRQGQPPPLVFSLEELRSSADVFAIELFDMRTRRRVLWGEDFLAGLEVPMDLHRLEVERELRVHQVRLRERYLAMPHDPRAVLQLMTASISSFLTLFRHALIALGEQAPEGRREVAERIAALVGFDAAPFHAVLDVREGKRKPAQVDVAATFHAYLGGITRVVEEVDRRLTAA